MLLRATPRIAARLAGLLAGLCALAAPARSADAPAGESPVRRELESFRTLGTVLHIGAHPDDENTELITWLSLGRGYRTAYLSITRGDGGQNELGKDFDEKLGVLRTQELLAARQLDHGRQFFTRAIDFGFSKSPEEALKFWEHDAVLGDVVRVIRTFRPDVIVTRFPIPPGSGGHGHHTASAILAVEAFKLAGDPTAYPEQLQQGLTVWQPKRVLWNSFRFGAAGPGPLDNPVIKEDIAGVDPVSGETFSNTAARSRAMHKTQGLGDFRARNPTGPNEQSFMILAGDAPAADLMDGVDTTWARYPGGVEIDRLAADALAQFQPDNPAASVPALLALRAKLATLPVDPLVTDKRAQLDRILQSCLGLKVQTTIANAELIPGEKVTLHYAISLGAKNVPVRWQALQSPVLKLADREGRMVDASEPLVGQLDGALAPETPVSQPYWLRADGIAALSRVDDPSLIGRPGNPPVIPVEYTFQVGDQTLVIGDEPVQPLHAVTAARASAPVTVIPPVSLALNSETYVFEPGATKPVIVEVTAARAHTDGRLHLEVPAGWSVNPGPQDFHLQQADEKASFAFTVTAPATGGNGRVAAMAEVDGRTWSSRRIVLDYSHLPVQVLQPPARARLASFPLATKGVTVGYVPGAGDSVAESIEQMGYTVRRLSGADLTPEKLAGLDAVVIGVRAFNERDDLAANLPALFAWVEAGGTLIEQYNRPNNLKAKTLGPYELSIEGSAPALRVTDETAPVTFLAPDHPVLNTPNKITAADFSGWVQERGAYFPSKWDEAHYVSILGMSDPGEAPLKSSLLVAQHGKGWFVYTGLAFFRQLPAGVPGAERLFANLVSLGK